MGYRLERPEKLLSQYLAHLEAAGQDVVSVDNAVEWARLPADGAPNWWGYRLSTVRGFAAYLHALDPVHQVPPAELLAQRPQRATPYLYSEADLTALIAAAQSLKTPLRRATMATLVGLLAVTGMRVGEAIALDRGDLDPATGRLVVRHGKLGKARELWLHPTTVEALAGYQRLRDQAAPRADTTAFFVSTVGQAAVLQRSPRLPPTGRARRAHSEVDGLPAADPRPAALLRGARDDRRL